MPREALLTPESWVAQDLHTVRRELNAAVKEVCLILVLIR
jgi:hypothetical protein